MYQAGSHFFDNLSYTTYNFQLVTNLRPHCRPPCLKASTYSTANADEVTPIQVAPKAKRCKRLQNVYLDDRGFPDQSDHYDLMEVLFCASSGILYRIRTHQLTPHFTQNLSLRRMKL